MTDRVSEAICELVAGFASLIRTTDNRSRYVLWPPPEGERPMSDQKPNQPPTAEPTRSSRGFAHMDPIPSEYGGQVRVYASSAVDPAIWVNVECPSDLNDRASAAVEAVAHVSIANARVLRDQLNYLLSEHDDQDVPS